MTRLKIVIIGRLIYPMSKPRANRATELAKEMAKQGHDVILYAVLGNYDYTEFSKKYNVQIKNLGNMLFATQNSDGYVRNSLLDRILRKLMGKTLDFPDIELTFKTKKVLSKEKNADLLITIGKPFTIHWGAALLKHLRPYSFPKRWIADCGDPYMGSQFSTRPFYFKYVEQWFSRKTDYITVPVEDALKGYYEEFHTKIKVIPQGFNFDEVKIPKKAVNTVPTFIYAGTFFANGRDPKNLLNYLESVENDFKFIIYTSNKQFVLPHTERLKSKLEVHSYIPRAELLVKMAQADFLINLDNGTTIQSPSKLIDYAIVDRPVLNILDSDIDTAAIDAFLGGDYSQTLNIDNIDQYRIETVVDRFLNIDKIK